jgi:hypothetical protein
MSYLEKSMGNAGLLRFSSGATIESLKLIPGLGRSYIQFHVLGVKSWSCH